MKPRSLDDGLELTHDVGSPMTFWILPAACKVIARSTVSSLTEDKRADPVVQTRMAELDLSIKEKIRDSLKDEADEDGEGEVVQVMGISPEVPDNIFLPSKL
jgi:hypothetical protein